MLPRWSLLYQIIFCCDGLNAFLLSWGITVMYLHDLFSLYFLSYLCKHNQNDLFHSLGIDLDTYCKPLFLLKICWSSSVSSSITKNFQVRLCATFWSFTSGFVETVLSTAFSWSLLGRYFWVLLILVNWPDIRIKCREWVISVVHIPYKYSLLCLSPLRWRCVKYIMTSSAAVFTFTRSLLV